MQHQRRLARRPVQPQVPAGTWWNGQYGRLVRRDIWRYTDGQTWRVEARQGDGDATVWHRDYGDEASARDLISNLLLTTGDTWRDLSDIMQEREALRSRPRKSPDVVEALLRDIG
jgi:hypothetical protein